MSISAVHHRDEWIKFSIHIVKQIKGWKFKPNLDKLTKNIKG